MRTIPVLATALAWTLAAAANAATIVDGAAIADEAQTANWLSYGRTYSEQRYSPLAQIDAGNVAKLGLDWALPLPSDRTLNASPIVVDGVLYFSGSYSVVRAVDAASGKLLWTYDPKVLEHAGDRQRIFWDSNRGVAYWKGKVFVATGDGRLNAIDAATGRELWSAQTTDPKLPLYINGAPRAFRDKIIIGNGGTEVGAARGYVTAYDTETGKQAWRFYVVPGNPADGFENKAMEMAAKTWTGEWWKHGGGGNTWNGFTYDPEFNRIYIGTGNGSPWNRKLRSPEGGDNLFLCSIVALDADTGEYAWHYQTTPGETWDYNSNMDMVLADLSIDGKPVKALMHAPKNGFFYVIDRATGKLVSAEKIGKVNWATHVDLATGRPVEREGARYEDGEELIWPGPIGVHNWHAMSYNPGTGLVYIPVHELPGRFTDKGFEAATWQSPNFYIDTGVEFLREDVPVMKGAAALMAWDPLAKKQVWRHELPGGWNAGTLTTAGNLVFQGRADGGFVAYDAKTGAVLWRVDAGLGISAPPVTYTVNGEQHIALLVGWGGAGPAIGGSLGRQHGWAYRAQTRHLLSFSLSGKAEMPAQPPPVFPAPIGRADFDVDALLAEQGNTLWAKHCVLCHGAGAISGGYAPDLRASSIPLYEDAFADVLGGSRRLAGMPRFTELTAADRKALQHYIRREARAAAAP
ncbi:MAG TPA: PQQ-dependent dehydrogenase, methanol/ethanol family [Gammaproteobacteria bacterium]|nr:PQQ-dependent dehydrogenase, methanol/ethanol family [Gammaproteobacteria bacterium]